MADSTTRRVPPLAGNVDPADEGYTDEEIRGLCVLAAAVQTAVGAHAAFGMTPGPAALVHKAATLVEPVTEFVRNGTVPEVPGAE